MHWQPTHTMDPKHNQPPTKEEELKSLQTMVAAPSSSKSSSSSSSSSMTTTTTMTKTVVAAAASPPPSNSSSPSHDFTFTISLYPSPTKGPNKSSSKSRNPANAIDLAPADDIFLHGHLLPLRLLTRPPFSPRRSAENIRISFNSTNIDPVVAADQQRKPSNDELVARDKFRTTRSLPSILTGIARRRIEGEREDTDRDKDKDKDMDKKKDTKKKKFDMMRMLKRYASLLETLLFSRGSAKDKRRDLRQRPCSFSGVSSNWSRGDGGGGDDWRRRGKKKWGEFSAPASMRTSPTNSGLLVAPANLGSSEESTMEELQSAIQAAIAHCKNSMNVKEDGCN